MIILEKNQEGEDKENPIKEKKNHICSNLW